MKTTSFRTCVVTRDKKAKEELTKITRINGIWYVDLNNELFGRSIYIDLNEENFNKFLKFQKRFKIEDENFMEIQKVLQGVLVEKNL